MRRMVLIRISVLCCSLKVERMEKEGVRGAAESSLHALSSAAGAITGIAILDVGRHIADELVQLTAALNDLLARFHSHPVEGSEAMRLGFRVSGFGLKRLVQGSSAARCHPKKNTFVSTADLFCPSPNAAEPRAS